MKITCPKNKKHKTFDAKEVSTNTIEVDGEGNHMNTIDSNVASVDYDESTCITCGAKAVVA